MKEEDLIKEAEHALHELEKKHLRHGLDKYEKDDEEKKNPFAYLIVGILIVIIVFMAIPYYAIKLDPEPKMIPLISDVSPYGLDKLVSENPGIRKGVRDDMLNMLMPDHPVIHNLAAKIATMSCKQDRVCYAKAMFYFVRDNIQYVNDPPHDFYESPFEILYARGADCDGMSILLANLLISVGMPVRFAYIPEHVYVQIKLNDAPKKYKEEDGWISLDPTCSECVFGEVPYSTLNKRKEFIYINT